MTKLAILIPCLNEEKSLDNVIKSIPKKIENINKIEIIVIDDGSTDKTKKIAEQNKVRIISNKKNIGLAKSFKKGIEYALSQGADIVVNIDGDNQYRGEDIPRLINPILSEKADIVIGNRNIKNINHFSIIKKFFQYLGSFIVKFLAKTNTKDTVSGFRAYSKESLLKINLTSNFSYVLDTIIQAEKKGLKTKNIDIEINEPTRESRLSNGIFDHIKKSSIELLRVIIMYEPLKTFIYLSFIAFLIGFLIIIRYLYFFFTVGGEGHVQSLIASVILVIFSLHFLTLGIIGDIISKNRILVEDSLYIEKKKYFSNKK